MGNGPTIGRQRKVLWLRMLPEGIFPGTPAEDEFIIRVFDGLNPSTFRANISRGFAPRHGPTLRSLCERKGQNYDPAAWLVNPLKKRSLKAEAAISWHLDRIDNVEGFYKQLEQVYRNAHAYESLRVGGTFSSNRTQFVIENGLAVKPAKPSIRLPYLRVLWDRIKNGNLTGQSVHLVRNLDRLLELWATLRLLKSYGLERQNKLTLVSSLNEGADEYEPTMGARVVDDRFVLFSMPAIREMSSQYSSWLRSERLSTFAQNYIRRSESTGRVLSKLETVGEEKVFLNAFEKIAGGNSSRLTNYGMISSFDDAIKIRERMLQWAEEKTWLPVIS